MNYFKGNDPSKWKTNISTYEVVTLGEVYKGIELKLKAYGNNVEKLFYVKPGANPDQIKIRLSGIQPAESNGNNPLIPLSEGDFADIPLSKGGEGVALLGNEKGARGLWVNEHGELVAETELGPVKFTKPVAYQEIDGKRVEVVVEYSIQNPEDVGGEACPELCRRANAPNRNGLNQSNGLEAKGKRQMSSGEKGMGRKGKYLASNLKPPTSNPQSETPMTDHSSIDDPKS